MDRMLVLLALAGLIGLLMVAGRVLVAARRRRALASGPLTLPTSGNEAGRVHLLAFSTPQCRQCRLLQKPALEEVRARSDLAEIVPIDALEQPELAKRYGILTVPSTVVLAADGRATAVNYGYVPAKLLLEQVQAAHLALAPR